MSKCPLCGSMERSDGGCRAHSFNKILGKLSRATTPQITKEPFGRSNRRHHYRFLTVTKIIASMVIVLVAISIVGAGMYLSGRASGPSCSNGAVSYPSCNTCGSRETYNSSTDSCLCTNNTVNPPSCNRFCANNAINPPTAETGTRGCDQCADGRTTDFTGPCPPPERTIEGLKNFYQNQHNHAQHSNFGRDESIGDRMRNALGSTVNLP